MWAHHQPDVSDHPEHDGDAPDGGVVVPPLLLGHQDDEYLKNEKMKQLFPLNSSIHSMKKRKMAKYKVNHAKSERYKRSPVVYMQNLLNHNSVNDEICAEDAHNHH